MTSLDTNRLKEIGERWHAHRGSVRLAYADGWYQELTKHYFSDRREINRFYAEMERQKRNWSGYSI